MQGFGGSRKGNTQIGKKNPIIAILWRIKSVREEDVSSLDSTQLRGAYPAPETVNTEGKSLFQSALDFFRGLLQPDETLVSPVTESATPMVTTTVMPMLPEINQQSSVNSSQQEETQTPDSNELINYEAFNRLTSAGGVTYNCDDNAREAPPERSGGENRLTGVTQGSNVFMYTYNGDGDQVSQTVNGAITNSPWTSMTFSGYRVINGLS
jgi:YD repeat-containing protein